MPTTITNEPYSAPSFGEGRIRSSFYSESQDESSHCTIADGRLHFLVARKQSYGGTLQVQSPLQRAHCRWLDKKRTDDDTDGFSWQ
jgi:hypothetical protein